MSQPKQNTLVIVICSLAMGATALKWSALNVLLPYIKLSLHASISDLQWILNIYGILGCSSIIFWAVIADRLSHRLAFQVGAALFIIGSLICTMASTPLDLIIGQGVIGLAAGSLLPLSQTLIFQHNHPTIAPSSLGRWSFIVGFFIAFGPTMGGFISHLTSWRVLFLLCGLIQCLALILSYKIPKQHLPNNKPIIHEIKSSFWLFATVFTFVLFIDRYPHWSQADLIRAFVLFLIFLIFFNQNEQKSSYPLFDPHFFKIKNYSISIILNGGFFFCLWPLLFIIPLYIKTQTHCHVAQLGLIMLSLTLPIALLPPIILKFIQTNRVKLFMAMGFTLIIASLCLFYQWRPELSWSHMFFATVLFGIAWGLIWSPLNYIGVSSQPSSRSGLGAGSFIAFQELSGTIGIAMMTVLVRSDLKLTTCFHDAILVLIAVCSLLLFIGLRFYNVKPLKNNH